MSRRARILGVVLPVAAALLGIFAGNTPWAFAGGIPPQVLQIGQGPPRPHSITVKVTIDPSGSATTFVLHYGATRALGATTPRRSVGSGNAPVTVSTTITGLLPGRHYFVQLVVSSPAGSNDVGPLPFVTGTSSGGGTPVPSPAGPGPRPLPPATERWQAVPVVAAGRGGGGLAAVSCRSTTCVAVGGSRNGPVAYRLAGSRLVPDTTAGLSNVALQGISCWAPAACMAVGYFGTTNDNAAYLLSEARWRAETVPSPKSVGIDELMSVSCLSARDCWAVGVMNGSTSRLVALVEHWDGGSWTVASAPRPSGSFLYSVSCVSAADCWAAGLVRDNGPDTGPLVEHWNGRRWAIVNVVSGRNGFTGISCVASRGCILVGGTTPLAFELVGATWHAIAPSSMHAAFTAVACASSKACWAIGIGTHGGSAAWQWDGSTWRTSAAPSGAGTELNGVSCLSATRCLAVGAGGVRAGGLAGPATRPLAVLTSAA